jgi:NHL repeat
MPAYPATDYPTPDELIAFKKLYPDVLQIQSIKYDELIAYIQTLDTNTTPPTTKYRARRITVSPCATAIASLVVQCIFTVFDFPIIRQAVSDNVMASLAPLIGPRQNLLKRLSSIISDPQSSMLDRAGAVVRIIFVLELLGVVATIVEQVWKGFDLLAGVFFGIKLVAKLTLALSTEGASLIIASIVALVDDAGKIVTEAITIHNTCGVVTTGLVETVAGVQGVGYVLSSPTGIALDSANNVYAVDSTVAQLKKWAPGNKMDFTTIAIGNAKPEWGISDWRPSFVALDGNLNAYVGGVLMVSKFTAGTPPQQGMASVSIGLRQFNGRPGGIVVDAAGNVYAADAGSNVVLRFAPGATAGGVAVAGKNEQLNPTGIALDAAGNIYVVDTGNHRVLKYPSGGGNGIVVAGGNGQGSGPTQLNGPNGIAVDSAGNVYVADTNNHRVQMFQARKSGNPNPMGIPVAGGQGAGSGPDQLNLPNDVKVDNRSMIYVADTGNNRVQRWDLGEK